MLPVFLVIISTQLDCATTGPQQILLVLDPPSSDSLRHPLFPSQNLV